MELVTTTQSRDERLVRVGPVVVRVSRHARGSEFRDLFDRVDWVRWLSAWPGVMSLFGWILHVTYFRREWIVSAEIVSPPGERWARRESVRGRQRAAVAFERLLSRVEQAEDLAELQSDSSGTKR